MTHRIEEAGRDGLPLKLYIASNKRPIIILNCHDTAFENFFEISIDYFSPMEYHDSNISTWPLRIACTLGGFSMSGSGRPVPLFLFCSTWIQPYNLMSSQSFMRFRGTDAPDSCRNQSSSGEWRSRLRCLSPGRPADSRHLRPDIAGRWPQTPDPQCGTAR